ncbi:hypothetical protein ABES25_11790 [Bacillus gobiensis]|uniref:hypothetical protein n=1 Tax=Bacillus gobiensis TaxID=1441095 RepID=UPI003D1ED41A
MKSKHLYKADLKRALSRVHADELLVKEIFSHVEESYRYLKDNGYSESEIYEKLQGEIGSPTEIAKAYKGQAAPTVKVYSSFYIMLNLLFFIGGAIVTALYLFVDIPFITALWSAKWLILCGYLIFWMLLGYQGGREYGVNGRKIMNLTVFVAILPNFFFMLIVLWNLIPGKPYETMLTPDFFLACIVSTFLFPVVSKIGFLFGRRILV